jgi:hypothetical protein
MELSELFYNCLDNISNAEIYLEEDILFGEHTSDKILAITKQLWYYKFYIPMSDFYDALDIENEFPRPREENHPWCQKVRFVLEMERPIEMVQSFSRLNEYLRNRSDENRGQLKELVKEYLCISNVPKKFFLHYAEDFMEEYGNYRFNDPDEYLIGTESDHSVYDSDDD